MADFIQLKKDNILRIGIRDAEGKETGEHLEFDMEDIELPLKINDCESKHKKNLAFLKSQFIIIDKKEDKKGKFILTWKEEEKIKVLQEFYNELCPVCEEFYKREMEALDLFLGDNGTKKLLNGRKPYYSMYEDINDILKPILPKLKINVNDITNKIKAKYSNSEDEKNVLE